MSLRGCPWTPIPTSRRHGRDRHPMAGPCRGGSRAVVSVPIEIQMNGIPECNDAFISLYGLSDVIITFQSARTNILPAKWRFGGCLGRSLPSGVTPGLSSSFPAPVTWSIAMCSRVPTARRGVKDDRGLGGATTSYRSVRGVADDSGFGGTMMQYQVLLDPPALRLSR